MSKVIFLNFPINYIAEYIPPHRQALYWGKYYQEDNRKYLLKENRNNQKVQLPFFIRESNDRPFFSGVR